MNDKILLNITLPATKRSYDFQVPEQLTVHEVSTLTARILADREPNQYSDNGGASLMNKQSGFLIDPSLTVRQANLVNGSQLVLV